MQTNLQRVVPTEDRNRSLSWDSYGKKGECRYLMKPNILDVRDRLEEMENHFLFTFHGQACGVDPISRTQYNMWYGSSHLTVSGVDEVFNTKFWEGKALTEIFSSVEINAY